MALPVQRLRKQLKEYIVNEVTLKAENQNLKKENTFLKSLNSDLLIKSNSNEYKAEINKLKDDINKYINENKDLKQNLPVNTPSVYSSNICVESNDINELKTELENTKSILNETQQQLKELEDSNIKLQGELENKNNSKHQLNRPNMVNKQNQDVSQMQRKMNLYDEVIRLKNIIENKNSVIDELKKGIPNVTVNIDGMKTRQIRMPHVRKKIFNLFQEVKASSSLLHVHINDKNMVKLNDIDIKNKLNDLINKSTTIVNNIDNENISFSVNDDMKEETLEEDDGEDGEDDEDDEEAEEGGEGDDIQEAEEAEEDN
jgi:hypothetical protein